MNSFILDLFLCAFVFGWKGDEAAEMAEHLVLIFVEEFMVMWQWMLKMWRHTTHDNFLRTYLSRDVDSSILI